VRMPPTRRGAHPKQRSSSLRAWFFDETTGEYSPCVWGSSGPTQETHAASGNAIAPYITDSPVGMGKRFISGDLTAMSAGSSADSGSISVFHTQNATVATWMKCTSLPAGRGCVCSLVSDSSTDTGPTYDDNFLFTISVKSNQIFEVVTEFAGGSNSIARSNYVFPMKEWVYVCIVKRPDGGSDVFYDLYVNGRFIETMTRSSGTGQNATLGADAYWQVGGEYNGTATPGNLFTGSIGGLYVWDESLGAAEIEEDYQRGLLLPFHTSQNIRVTVEKPDFMSSSFFYDATQLDGLDFVSSLNTSNSPDNACVAGTVKLLREQENLSLAYLKNDTRLNLLDPTDTLGTVERFLEINRGLKIYTGTTPLGIKASGRDYWQFLDGTIDGIDWGSEETSVMFRDKGGVLIDTFIEADAFYGNEPDAVPPLKYAAEIMGEILTANATPAKPNSYDDPGAPVSLVAAPYEWAVNKYNQKREPVMVALRTIAGQFGHDVKYRWDDETESFKLVLFEPERDSITISSLFGAQDIKSVSKAEIAGQRIRNVVRVSYDSAEANTTDQKTDPSTGIDQITFSTPPVTLNPAPDGHNVNGTTTPGPGEGEAEETPGFVELEHTVSMSSYGRRFMEVQESSTSQINTGKEAAKMALSMLLDLAEPEFDHSVTVPLMPTLDIYDIIGFQPNSYLYTESQYLAVASVDHSFQEDATTTISLRGKPNLGFKRWLAMESRGAPNPANSPEDASGSLTKMQKLQPLQSVLSKSQMNMGGRYMQVRNNAFTTWADGRLNPPTSWNTLLGSFDGTSMGFSETSKTGALSVVFSAASNSVQSDLIPLDGYDDNPYALECSWQIDESTPGVSTDVVQVSLDFYDADGVFIPASTQVFTPGSGFPSVTGKKQQWYTSRSMGVSPPAGDLARYFRITTEKDAGTDKVVVDNVSLYKIAPEMKALLSTSLVWENTPDNSLDYTVIGNTYNVCWGNVSSPDGYDYGSNIDIDEGGAAPPPNYTGHSFVVPVDGNYEISSQCFLRIHNTNNAGGTSAGTFTIGMQIRTGVEYGSTGEVLVVGSTVASSGWLNADIPALGPLGTWFPLDFISVSPTPVYLSAGDKVSCVLLPGGNFAAGTPGFETGPFAGGLGGEISFFRVKLLDQT